MRTRRDLLRSALGWLAALGAGSRCAPSGPENLLLVSADTLRRDHVGAFGNRWIRTPALDSLGRGGVAAEDAWTASSWTLPSHVSLMTSLPPSGHGVIDASSRLGGVQQTLAGVLGAAGWRTCGMVSNLYCTGRYGLDSGFSEFADARARRTSHCPADLLSGRALVWIGEAAARREPFFLWLHFYDPHWPYLPPSPFDRLYGEDESTVLARYNRRDRDVSRDLDALQRDPASLGLVASDLARARQLYAGEISFMDAEIGRVLGAIAGVGLASRTVVAFVSDHGEHFGEQGRYFAHHLPLSPALLMNPLLLAAPGRIPAGSRYRGTVDMIDVAPTLLGLLGVEVPGEFRGRDLSSAMSSGRVVSGLPAVCEHLSRDPRLVSRAAAGEGYFLASEPAGERFEAIFERTGEQSSGAIGERSAGARLDARALAKIRRRLQRRLEEHSETYPRTPDAEKLDLDDDEKARLRSLGYLM